MSGLEQSSIRRGSEIGGRRAQVSVAPITIVELDLPAHLRSALETAGSQTGAWVTRSSEAGNSVTVSGHPDEVSRALKGVHPPRDKSILPAQTRGLRGPTSRRAMP